MGHIFVLPPQKTPGGQPCRSIGHVSPSHTTFPHGLRLVLTLGLQDQLGLPTLRRRTQNLGRHHQRFSRLVSHDDTLRKRSRQTKTSSTPTTLGRLPLPVATSHSSQPRHVPTRRRKQRPRSGTFHLVVSRQGRRRSRPRSGGGGDARRIGGHVPSQDQDLVLGRQTDAAVAIVAPRRDRSVCASAESTVVGVRPDGARIEERSGRTQLYGKRTIDVDFQGRKVVGVYRVLRTDPSNGRAVELCEAFVAGVDVVVVYVAICVGGVVEDGDGARLVFGELVVIRRVRNWVFD
mmetsp:Transcript_86197/g.129179  ORF Transcript_86197/g.129179 Transcript_86197/m.129179 type:complete len:291 (+) Transcript_86197:763-1635(+)